MCGIAGSLNLNLPAGEVVNLLKHRGPDDYGAWQEGSVQLINTRLAIQGLGESGKQPMILDDCILVFNGEIYNHFELRKIHNLDCTGTSDTETLLRLYRKMGRTFLQLLDGMFAFCLYDRSKAELWLARDRMGEKPLYYFTYGSRFAFASELQVLSQLIPVEPDDQMVSNFLFAGFLPGNNTSFKNIKQLEPGCQLVVNVSGNSHYENRWFDIGHLYSGSVFKGTLNDALAETDRLLEAGVKSRIQSSEREVGTFLSGGIDSGLITAKAALHTSRLKTFTITFDGLYDEAPLARSVAHQFSTDHREIRINLDNLPGDLETILSNYGEPIVDDSVIPSYYVAREASRYVPVVLTGDGGDELFAGYRRYVPFSRRDFFRSKPISWLRNFNALLPHPGNKLQSYNFFYRLSNLLAAAPESVYHHATLDLMHDELRNFEVNPDTDWYERVFREIAGSENSGLGKMLHLDSTLLLPKILLKKMDIASMRWGLESRAPFLSSDLLKWSCSLPDQFRIKGLTTKYLLRKLASRHLPKEIPWHPKRGFEIPLVAWMEGTLKPMVMDYLSNPDAYINKIVNPEWLSQLLSGKLNCNPERRARLLFAMLSIEVWKRSMRLW